MGNCNSPGDHPHTHHAPQSSHPTPQRSLKNTSGHTNTRRAVNLCPNGPYEAAGKQQKQKEYGFNRDKVKADVVDNVSESESDGEWPWSWLENPLTSALETTTTAEYSGYLERFKILNAREVQAYQQWCSGDPSAARSTLSRCPKSDSPPPQHDTLEGLQHSPAASYYALNNLAAYRSAPRHAEVLNQRRNWECDEQEEEEMPLSPTSPQEDKMRAFKRRTTQFAVYEPKTEEQMHFLTSVLSGCALFSHLVRQTDLQNIALSMRRVVYKRGQKIHCRGYLPLETSGFSIIASGRISVEGLPLGRGSFFGENLVTAVNTRAKKNVSTLLETEVYVLSNHDFTTLMTKQAKLKVDAYKEWLQQIPFLKSFRPAQFQVLSEALEERSYAQGQRILEYGKPAAYMHLVVEGEVDVFGRVSEDGVGVEGTEPKHVCSFPAGTPVGYIEFFEASSDGSAPTNIADVVAKTDTTITACIDKAHFEKIFGTVSELFKELTDAPEYEYYREVKAKQAIAKWT